jgi:multidrug efflux pump subunit AcrA (membrane-fusion protein)
MREGLTMREREQLLALLSGPFEASASEALVAALDQVMAWRAEMVTRQDFHDLQAVVARLAEGQQEFQAAVARLTEAQARTEEALKQLTAAQARTEQRVDRLETAVAQLTEAQARTDEALKQLTAAQARTEQRLEQLAQAQAQTELALQNLARQVGGLSETVGGDIEDIAYIVLHDVLKREFGWDVGVLERTWQQWDGEAEEVNVFGQARDPARSDAPIWIVGEAKHNLTLREVERFANQVARARQYLVGNVFPVCFCYRARPEVRARLQELGIRLVFSYGRMI